MLAVGLLAMLAPELVTPTLGHAASDSRLTRFLPSAVQHKFAEGSLENARCGEVSYSSTLCCFKLRKLFITSSFCKHLNWTLAQWLIYQWIQKKK